MVSPCVLIIEILRSCAGCQSQFRFLELAFAIFFLLCYVTMLHFAGFAVPLSTEPSSMSSTIIDTAMVIRS